MNSFPLPSHSWHLVGTQPGPCVVILGGTHGDERAGIEVIHQLRSLFDLHTRPAGTYPMPGIAGELFLILGNPEAIRLRQRAASGQRDLNRSFIHAELNKPATPEDSPDLIRARELAPILSSAGYLFDLHATSSDSPPFVVCGSVTPIHRTLIPLLPVAFVLTDPSDVLAKDEGLATRGTTDAYVEAHGGTALGYETGKENDISRVDAVTDDVIRLLQKIGTISSSYPQPRLRRITPCPSLHQQMYALTHSVQARATEFHFHPMFREGWKTVSRDQEIGRYEDGTIELAPADGMIVFPKAEAKIRPGGNLYYLAQFSRESYLS